MSKRKFKELFAKTVCAHAGSVIAVLLCLAGLTPVFLLGAFVPEEWLLNGIATLVLVAGFLLFRRWSVARRMGNPMMGFALLEAIS
jgi:hypothetical protein